LWVDDAGSARDGDRYRQEVAGYYTHLTALYQWYGGDTHGWHFGVWDAGVANHEQALHRANEILLEGLAPRPATRILDVGFGSGGFATWAAARFGCRVTGITVCPEHVRLARALARARGVAERCTFLVMDMDALGFRDECFDVVINQETFCHSRSRPRYLCEVFRVLAPGGSWRAVAFSIRPTPRSGTEERRYLRVCQGFRIPSLSSEAEVRAMSCAAGFEEIQAVDLTERVGRTASNILWFSRLPELLMPVGLGRLLFPLDPARRRSYRGHVSACAAYARGLRRGPFRHVGYSARKPQACSWR
jgi:cyclopropane fatty-acyl-phospholipid synthase-like methyltransferase